MSEPPLDGGPGQPAGGDPVDPGSPDYDGAPDDGPRRGAHRAGGRPTPPPPPPAGAPYWPQPDYQPDEPLKRPLIDTLPLRLLQAGFAIVVVIVLIVVLNMVLGGGGKTTNNDTLPTAGHKTTTAATTSAAVSPSATPKSSKTAKPSKTTKPSKTAKPSKTVTPSKTTKPTTKPTATAKPTTEPTVTAKPTTAAPPPVDVKAPLLVLNNSRIHGLAVSGAATFRRGGWTVTGTGNFQGRLAQTTVYYSPGLKAAAETLARQFPSVTEVEPRPSGVPGSSLTVVLTRYFKP